MSDRPHLGDSIDRIAATLGCQLNRDGYRARAIVEIAYALLIRAAALDIRQLSPDLQGRAIDELAEALAGDLRSDAPKIIADVNRMLDDAETLDALSRGIH